MPRPTAAQRAREKPCLRCGYSLRGSLDARLCPECGLPLWISLNPQDSLTLSNPDWLGKLIVGFRLAALTNFIATLLGGVIVLVCIGSARSFGVPTRTFELFQFGAIVALNALLASVAVFLLASPEGRFPNKLAARQWSVRFVAVTLVFAAGVVFVTCVRRQAIPSHSLIGDAFLEVVVLIAIMTKPLARRLGDRAMSKAATFLTVSAGIALLLTPGVYLDLLILGLYRRSPGTWAFIAAVLVLPLIAAIVCVMMARRVNAARVEAYKQWASE